MIATPDVMGAVGRIGKILGPRGLMPNPRVGTVTFDVAKAVRRSRRARSTIGSTRRVSSMPVSARLVSAMRKADRKRQRLIGCDHAIEPSTAKGNYVKGVAVSSTMGPGVKVDIASAARTVAAAA